MDETGIDMNMSISQNGYVFAEVHYDPKLNDGFTGCSVYRFCPERANDNIGKLSRQHLEKIINKKIEDINGDLICVVKNDDVSKKKILDSEKFNDLLNALSFFDMPKGVIEELDRASINYANIKQLFSKKLTIEQIKARIYELRKSATKERGWMLEEIWTGLPITEVHKVTIGGNVKFRILIDGKQIDILSTNLLKQDIFRTRFYEAFGVLLPICPVDLWLEIPSYLNSITDIFEHREIASQEELIRDSVKNYIEGAHNVEDYDNCVSMYQSIRVRDGKISIYPKHLKDMLHAEFGRELDSQNEIIPALISWYVGTAPRKLKTGRSERFWHFKCDAFDLSQVGGEDEKQANFLDKKDDENV